MYTNEMDVLPVKLRLGTITKKQAAMKVMEAVYTNPGRFGIQDMDEDSKSEFLIDMLPKFESLLERHDFTKSPFGAYLYYSLPGLRKTWVRRKKDDITGEHAMAATVKDIYETTKEKTLRVAMPNSIEERRRNAPQSENYEIPASEAFNEIFKRRVRGASTQTKINQKRSALVLALKSAWYIDDSQIDRISDFCECPKSDIANRVLSIRDGLVEKNERYADLAKKRDKAWYFICKYREQLAQMDETTEAYLAQKRKLQYQLKSWKKKNSLIQKSVRRIRPDNYTVAKALNLDPHKITSYINYARQIAENKESML